MNKGFLVTFEGGEGCGKSTQVKKFIEYLLQNKYDFISTREPGGTPFGEKVRQISQYDDEELDAKVEALLIGASRCKLVQDVVSPALQQGKIVVMDRFYDSSLVYQGYAGSNGKILKDVKAITKIAVGKIRPNLTFFLDITPENGIERKAKKSTLDRYERKDKDYHTRVREGYLTLAKLNKDRYVVIDANKPIEEIFNIIVDTFKARYSKFCAKQR